MTKYYLTLNINYTHINKLMKKIVSHVIIVEKTILCNDGFIKKEDDKYIKYTLEEENETKKIYLDDLECYTDDSYEKNMGEVYQIPLEHELIHVKKYIFKPFNKSLIQFVIETSNYNIVDYYFENKKNKLFEIKNEIVSFLSDLRNILYI